MPRATRSSVRAGAATLAKPPPATPSKRSTRKRSASVTTASSTDATEQDIRKSLLRYLPFANYFASFDLGGPIDACYFVNELKSGRTTSRKLTRSELEAVTETLLARDHEQEHRLGTATDRINELEEQEIQHSYRIRDLSSSVSELNNKLMDTRKVRDIRRHYTIEVPTQQKLRDDAAKAAAHAEAAKAREADIEAAKGQAEQERQAKTARDNAKKQKQKEARLTAEREARITADRNAQEASEPTSDAPTSSPPPALTPHSSSSWSFSNIFGSAIKRVFSPSRQTPRPLSSQIQKYVPSPVQEESPSAGHPTTNGQQDETEDTDLSQIVRKRKTASSQSEHVPKRAKVTDHKTDTTTTTSSKSFSVPSDSDDDDDDMHIDDQNEQPAARRDAHVSPTPSKATSSRMNGRASLHPQSRDSPHPTNQAAGHPDSQSQETPTHKRSRTPSRVSSKTPRPAMSQPKQGSQAQSDQARDNLSTPSRQTATEGSASNSEPASNYRRSAKKVREQREAAHINHKNNNTMTSGSQTPRNRQVRSRPRVLYTEVVNYDQYATDEEAQAAIDAMLDIEMAEDEDLPIPKTTVTPAIRVIPRVRADHLAPPRSAMRSSALSASATRPREANADKRNALATDVQAERVRLMERAKRLRKEQLEAEEELKKLELEEEASHEVGKKRKRVKVDDLKVIPSRRPGQSQGTFALLDEFFDLDDTEVEMDESQVELFTPRPAKKARTEMNVFEAQSPAMTPAQTPARTPIQAPPQLPAQTPMFAPAAAKESQAAPTSSQAQPQPHQDQALQRKRSEAEKYKPTVGSRLREVSRLSNGSSAAGSPMSGVMANVPPPATANGSSNIFAAPATPSPTPFQAPLQQAPAAVASYDPNSIFDAETLAWLQEGSALDFTFPGSEAIVFDDEPDGVPNELEPITAEYDARVLKQFQEGLAAWEKQQDDGGAAMAV